MTNPVEVMEARKKKTYAPEDQVEAGQVKKSVDIQAELNGSMIQTKDSIGFYKQLEDSSKEPIKSPRSGSNRGSRRSSASSRHSDDGAASHTVVNGYGGVDV